jgi:hypothetical protein
MFAFNSALRAFFLYSGKVDMRHILENTSSCLACQGFQAISVAYGGTSTRAFIT